MRSSLVDLLARAIHGDYLDRRASDAETGEDEPSLRRWEELPETLRRSNLDQALDIANKLGAVGCTAVRRSGDPEPLLEFAPEEVERLARLEHDRWMADRLRDGWRPGPARDAEEKRSPYLVDWDALEEAVRDLDRDTVRAIPRFLASVGFDVVRRPTP